MAWVVLFSILSQFIRVGAVAACQRERGRGDGVRGCSHRRGRRDGVEPAQDHVGDVQKKCKSLSEKYASRGVTFHCVHKEDVAGALAGIFTMGIAMNDDKVYLVVTQKEASA